MKSILLRIWSALLVSVMLLPVGRSQGETYDVQKPDDCVLHFTVLSDSHIEANNYARYRVFATALQDVQRNQSGNDAIVFLGDNTMNGNLVENSFFHGTVARLLRHETILPVMGNHDIGNGQGNYDRLQKRWYAFTEAFFGKQLSHPYYFDVIDGFYCIVMGTEAHESNKMAVSDAQFAFLDDVLAKAADSKKPAFVFMHHPTYCATNLDGEYTDRLTDTLAAYNREHDLFCFVGHTHMSFSPSRSIRTYDGFPEIFLPCLTKLSGEKDDTPTEGTGIGVQVEVYPNEVVIRGRDYFRSAWRYDAKSLPLRYGV